MNVISALIGMGVALTSTAVYAREPMIRESLAVRVGDTVETWQILWLTKPRLACQPPDPGWFTCPCSGFEFGQRGRAAIVRLLDGKEIDRLEISGYFNGDYSEAQGEATLPYKPLEAGDIDHAEDRSLTAQISHRPTRKVVSLADYDHDGRATEFVLQTSTEPCGKHYGIAIGISRAEPKLHAFSTIADPGQPLELPMHLWEQLSRGPGPLSMVTWSCGDHGSDVESELEVEAAPKGFRVVSRDYECADGGKRGALRNGPSPR